MAKEDFLRLAGVRNTFSLDDTKIVEPASDNVKYVLLSAIEKYNDAANNSNLQNSIKLYADIIKKIDQIIGYISNNDSDNAKSLFSQLDKTVQNNILALDTDNEISNYFNTEKTDNIMFQITNESYNPDDVENCTVPSEVINDLKSAIKELDDGNNYEYISHLSGAKDQILKYQYIKQVLEQLITYFTNANNLSIKHASVYVTAVDNDTKVYIPASVWKFLAVNYSTGESILDKMKKVDLTGKFKPSEIVKPVSDSK